MKIKKIIEVFQIGIVIERYLIAELQVDFFSYG